MYPVVEKKASETLIVKVEGVQVYLVVPPIMLLSSFIKQSMISVHEFTYSFRWYFRVLWN